LIRHIHHHVSGRLRLKFLQLKGNANRAKQIEIAIRQLKGVISVEVNRVTGSVLVHYDAIDTGSHFFLDTLEKALLQLGLTIADGKMPNVPFPQTSSSSAIADKVVTALVEKLIERSAIALMGALL
jgi:copper chaperone CopZ